MRKLVLSLTALLFTANLLAQESNDIIGYWLNEEKDAKVEIFMDEGQYFGKIIWLLNAKHPNGEWMLDEKNPDESLRHRRKLGLTVMHNLVWDESDKEWNSGKIYDAREGDTYSLFAKMDGMDILNLRGYIGFSLFGRTTTWTRTTI